MNKLTEKQKLFVACYLIHLNASKAALEAGYSEKTAFRIGAENLQKPAIKKAIDQGIKERSKRIKLNQDMVISELAKIAFSEERDSHKIKCLEMLAKHFQLFDKKNESDNKQEHIDSIRKRLNSFLEDFG